MGEADKAVILQTVGMQSEEFCEGELDILRKVVMTQKRTMSQGM